MDNENMGKITISLSKEDEKKLRDRAEKNYRSISKEVSFLLNRVEEIEEWNRSRVFKLDSKDKEEYQKMVTDDLPHRPNKDKVK